MEIMNLKKAIVNKKLPDNQIILTGDEALMSIYLDQINKNFETKKLSSLQDYFNIVNSKFNLSKNNIIYLIEEDENYKNSTSLWSYKFNNVIFIYSNLDKREKFYKAFEPYIVYFDKLSNDLLKGIIKNRVNLPVEDIDWIIQSCNSNYFKCLNEIEKISIFNKDLHKNLFIQYKKDNILCVNDNIQGYDFVNTISNKDKISALELINKLNKDDIIGQLSLIYSSLKNQLLVQGGNQTAEQLGMNPKLYYVLSKKKLYSIEQLCNCLLFISDKLNKIKLGTIEPIDAINLFVLECL